MQKSSFKSLADSKKELEAILDEFGLNLSPHSWIHRAYYIVESLAEIYADNNRRENFMKQENKNADVYFALHDITVLGDILPFLKDEDRGVIKGKIKKILRMDSPPLEDLPNNEARNTLWELNLYSRLKRANIQATLGDPNPDILATLGQRQYYIQCKRVYSPGERALRQNIARAVGQLINDLETEGDDAFGMLAFSIERPLTKGELMLVTESEQIAREKLRGVLEEFRKRYGHLWQDPSVIRDPRIVAVALHILVPGVVENENIFITGSQIDVNNTWLDDGSFKKVVEDFGPLKSMLGF